MDQGAPTIQRLEKRFAPSKGLSELGVETHLYSYSRNHIERLLHWRGGLFLLVKLEKYRQKYRQK